ncbi:hypothetical protein C0Q70_10297 [Pomacea canaliculata]|uniref:Uncharacterized protein n=1 Tax=Pomacea canaliculata TaxID=400727 RepID=A0A2T7PC83_POMCA|nr:hypothetical protein C0Q70_10297 [Pomacea canaliculata]
MFHNVAAWFDSPVLGPQEQHAASVRRFQSPALVACQNEAQSNSGATSWLWVQVCTTRPLTYDCVVYDG